MVYVGVHHTLEGRPQGLFFLHEPVMNFADGGLLIYTFPVHKHRHQQLLHVIIRNGALFPGVHGVEDGERLAFVNGFRIQGHQVSQSHVIALSVDPVNFLIARIGDLPGIVRYLELGLAINFRQFIYPAEGRAIIGGDELGANAPGVNFGALELQVLDQVLVEV
ncbi:hypothetical protein SDC9_195652 [bioreactor metagenome]|uniref:Uncharacterized protein n=1 Tax=bioreactor metagenome TaxID=1076179 RepID=A0A645I9X0_9ZZZZ